MASKFPPEHKQLYRRCDEVLHYLWDPIGIAGTPGARDEYESYVPQVLQLVLSQVPAEEIAEHLCRISKDSMGLGANLRKARHVAQVLLDWRRYLEERAA